MKAAMVPEQKSNNYHMMTYPYPRPETLFLIKIKFIHPPDSSMYNYKMILFQINSKSSVLSVDSTHGIK